MIHAEIADILLKTRGAGVTFKIIQTVKNMNNYLEKLRNFIKHFLDY